MADFSGRDDLTLSITGPRTILISTRAGLLLCEVTLTPEEITRLMTPVAIRQDALDPNDPVDASLIEKINEAKVAVARATGQDVPENPRPVIGEYPRASSLGQDVPGNSMPVIGEYPHALPPPPMPRPIQPAGELRFVDDGREALAETGEELDDTDAG